MALTSKMFGANLNMVVVWAKNLEQASYYQKAEHDIFESFSNYSESDPIHQIGQEATNAPAACFFLVQYCIIPLNLRLKVPKSLFLT